MAKARPEDKESGRGKQGKGRGDEPTRGEGREVSGRGGSQVTESGRFQNMSIEELRKEAQNKNIKNPENQSKDELVRKLKDAEERSS